MEWKTDALMLGAIDYKDNDKLLTLFTAERGIVRASIKGVKKPSAKLNFAAQPFAFAEYVLVEKGEFYTVKSAYLYDGFYPLRSDIERYYAANSVAEVCKAVAPEHERIETLLVATVQALKELAYTDADCVETLVGYMLLAAGEAGYFIDLDGCGVCGGEIEGEPYFDFDAGHFTCQSCGGGQRASVSTYHTLKKCAALEYDEALVRGGKKRALRLMKVFLGEKTEADLSCVGELLRLCEE
ncbi:MAG: DNA repair protein RecO [Clostridia bacterium]|nr:DNA repair protein RecO [Clostridia bacterium]